MVGSVLGTDGSAVCAKLVRKRTHYGVRRDCSGT